MTSKRQSPMKQTVLGIDPGSSKLGYVSIEYAKGNDRLVVLAAGHLDLATALKAKNSLQPDLVIVELPAFTVPNEERIMTTVNVGRIIGQCDFRAYNVNQWRRYLCQVTGTEVKGKAVKDAHISAALKSVTTQSYWKTLGRAGSHVRDAMGLVYAWAHQNNEDELYIDGG